MYYSISIKTPLKLPKSLSMITETETTMSDIEESLVEKDLKGLRIFRAAAEAGGFGAAEQRLRMSRATISRRIKDVESKLGTPLCTRGPQGFELTEAGRAVLGLTSEALDALDRIKPHVDALRGLVTGDLAIGITDNAFSNPNCRVGEALRQLGQTARGLHLEIHTLTLTELTRALVERRIHVAIQGTHERSASLHYVELFDEVHLIYASGATLDTGGSMPLVNRLGQPFVSQALGNHNFSRGPDAIGLDSVALLIRSGQFCGILPRHYAELFPQSWDFRIVPDTQSYSAKFCAVTDTTRPLPPSGMRFLELLKILHSK
jgi:DNA-binding transcriptional LysR family regulator